MATTRSGLHASPGDRLVIHGHRVGEVSRDGEIVDVLGPDGTPPYVVRWEGDGHVSRLYPGSDAYVERFGHGSPAPARAKPRSAAEATDGPPADTRPLAADWEAAVPPRDS